MKASRKSVGLVSFIAGAGIVAGCSTSATKTEPSRFVANETEPAAPFASTAYGRQFAKLKLNNYGANLHAHHFMGVRGSKKNPIALEDYLRAGPCTEKGTYPADDGRPCRDVDGQTNQVVLPRGAFDYAAPDYIDYFRQACEYATTDGALDVFFLTPHTKNNEDPNAASTDTSTPESELLRRQALLASMNPDRLGSPKFLCGMGQEASSISAGNHINIFGQFHAGDAADHPFFFKTGDFRALYPAIKARNAAGEKVFLQFNHPDVLNDTYWGDLSKFSENKKSAKANMNDYGLDDFGPVSCMDGKLPADAPDCAGVTPLASLSDAGGLAALRKSYANIRAAAGDPFRLIEVIPPGAGKEGEVDTDGDGTADGQGDTAFGATTNTKTNFRRVQHRTDANTYEEGVYNWIYYLSMGFRLAPTANQDNHHMNWGSATASRTGIVAANLKENTILDALRARHTFASEDQNAKALLTQTNGKVRTIMGDAAKVTGASTRIQVAYYDPDGAENGAHFRLYYYRASDDFDMKPVWEKYVDDQGKEKSRKVPPKAAYHTVSFDAKNRATLPSADAADRSANDLVPIRSGEVVSVVLPVVSGTQWVFAEIVQDGDFDKTWTAPIWLVKK
ncbi:MAG: hypothetical protein JST04_11835 [Bdellovibrionales bacterium]|nr:hypothetical protein [Bdellovibrionales bacterium]